MNFNFDKNFYRKKYGKFNEFKDLYKHWLNVGRFKNMYTSENNEIIKPNIKYFEYKEKKTYIIADKLTSHTKMSREFLINNKGVLRSKIELITISCPSLIN